jgi:small subunit ribosomal protein S1
MSSIDETMSADAVTDAGASGDGASLMEQLLNDPAHDYKTLNYGQVMEGEVMYVDRDEILVDIGSKSEGIIPSREFSTLTEEEKTAISVGDNLLVFVVQAENQEGQAVLSIDRARQEKSWRRLQEQHEAAETISAEVTNYNKGGLLVNLDGVRGFVPASQVTEIRGGDDGTKQADMARLIGTSLPLKIIEINRHRNRLILSERQAVQEKRDVMKERLIEELTEGETRRGRVTSICDFGAFVDVGGADGLVHLSELSWSRVKHPSEVLSVGEEVDVYVLGINAEEKKIALSIKRTQPEPWSQVAMKYEVGQLVRSTVTQLANFGAFARIEDGIEGLIHVSELSEQRIGHPRQVVSEGQDMILRIIRIDPARRRMGLSLRRALEATDEEVAAALGEDAVALKHELLAQEIEPDESEEAEPVEASDDSEVTTSEDDASDDDDEDAEAGDETVAEVESEPEVEQEDDTAVEASTQSTTDEDDAEAAESETEESEPADGEETADSDDDADEEPAEEAPRADDGTERAG